jgi:hypothetical protein
MAGSEKHWGPAFGQVTRPLGKILGLWALGPMGSWALGHLGSWALGLLGHSAFGPLGYLALGYRPGFFREKNQIFRKILFFEFFEKWPPKNSKKNYLISDTIWLQLG